MALKFNFYGCCYDNSEPAFITAANGMTFDRLARKWILTESLEKSFADAGYSPDAGEIGPPSAAWAKANMPEVDFSAGQPEPEPEQEKKPKRKKKKD